MNNKEKYFLIKAAAETSIEELFEKDPVIPVPEKTGIEDLFDKPPVIPVPDTGVVTPDLSKITHSGDKGDTGGSGDVGGSGETERIWVGGGDDYGPHPEMPDQMVYKPDHPDHFKTQEQAEIDKIDAEVAKEVALANAAESLRNGGNLVESSGGADTGLTVGDVKKEVTRLDDMDVDPEAQRADQEDGKVYADKSLAQPGKKAPTREQAGRGKEEWGGTLEEGKPYRKPQEKKDEPDPGTPWWHYALGLGGLGGLGYLGYNMLKDDDDEDEEEKRKKRRRR